MWNKLVLAVVSVGTMVTFVPSAQASVCVRCDVNGCETYPPPCEDATAVAFTAIARIDCFGCGDSQGTAHLDIIGGGTAEATYTVNEPAIGPACVVTGTASGSTTGAINVTFSWTRVGATALITTGGEIEGAGVAAFHVTEPSGIPCGATNVVAEVVGAVGGQS